LDVKKEVLKDVSQKIRTWRAKLKRICKIQPGDMPDVVRERIKNVDLSEYNAGDVSELVERWC